MPPLNVNELEELFEKGDDNPEIVNHWYEKLSEYDPEDIEVSESVKQIMKAMKWIMHYEHVNGEELKELLVKEAAEMAEKQENWDEEKENMNLELKLLRERTTATANVTDISETFRTRINSLTDENVYLKEQNKERDCELAEKNDKVEKLTYRVEQLQNEREKFIQQQTFLNESIHELTVRLENKMDESMINETKALQLQQRSQQAALLSKQLQEVAQQNDEFRAEIQQLSTALASATTFIEDTANNYQALYEQLLESDKIIERLTNDNELLGKKLDDEKITAGKLGNADENSIQHYKELLQSKNEQIETLKLKFETLQIELQELQSQSILENNVGREKEMEKLRVELLDATKVARQLFGVAVKNNEVNGSIAQMKSEITSLNETIDKLHWEVKQREMENDELIHNLEMKDIENQKVNIELKRLREEIFGSAEDEISRLEKQINFREQQIEKLTAKCSLLQVELSSTFDVSDQKLEGFIPVMNSVEKSLIPVQDKVDDRSEIEPAESLLKPAEDAVNFLPEMKESDSECKAYPEGILKVHKRPLKLRKKKEEYEGSLKSLEASAMIISSLNHELMLLMQELDEKDRQLQRMEKSVEHAANSIDELKVNYFNLQKEVSEYDMTQYNKTIDELRKKMECYEIEIEEYQKLANSIRLSGNEMQQKVEEMNRQVVAERLRNLQLIRKLEIIERNRNTENVEHKKVARNYQQQRLLHMRQFKIANYESDLATIEIARLQTLLLHSVPKKDYDQLLLQHKQLLASDDNYKLTNDFKNDEMRNEYIVVNLLEMNDEIKNAEVTVENTHLKGMINVLRSQNEYWQIEVEKIREQNTEMMHFLDDVESESQMKSLLVALERRFLKALSDRAEFSQNQKLTDHQFLDQQNEFARKKRSWANEKKKLIQMIRSLQLLFQRMRSNSMELLTVQQMMQYKEKIAEINSNYTQSQKYKEEIEREKDELDLQLRHAEALRKSYELLQENDYDVIKLRKSLQASHLNMLNAKKQLENAEIQMQRKDERIQKLEEIVQNLQKEIEDLFAITIKISDFDDENERIYEAINPSPITDELFQNIKNEETKIELKSDIQSVSDEKGSSEMEESENIGKGETPTETIDSESDVKFHAITELHATGDTRKIAHIHPEEYMKKLNYIRETAKLCIANYKEQLKYKDEVIEKYKSLLKIMPDENDTQQNIDDSALIVNDLAERKLRTSSEILFQNYNSDIEAKDMEIVKLRNEIEQFNKANRRLTKDLQHFRNQIKPCTEISTQTDLHAIMDDDEIEEGIISNEENNLKFNVTEESTKSITSQEPLRTRTPSSLIKSNKHNVSIKVNDTQNNDIMMETLRREESKTMTMRMEIRDLKQRNAILRIKNQELEKACERIRVEALSEIKQSYTSNINDESEAIVMKLQQELSDLKLETGNQKKLIREQKEIIDRLQKNQSVKNSQEEISKWHEKKAREGSVNVLRKKLKEMEQREQEICERLKKRDQEIKQLHKLENSRRIELKRLQEMIKSLENDREMSNLEMKILNDRLRTAEETNIYLNQKIGQMKKESNELLLSANNEKEKLLKGIKIRDDTIEINRIEGHNISDEELHKLREKAEKYDDIMKQLIKLETEVKKQHEEIRLLNDKLNERKYDCGAVAVLRDKLMAKEKVIEQQQQRIEELEREKWQNLL
ncbi:unnamed protein product [Cercopithifilaria johnstoni]|uniref:Uncharacterized protein n=1 Tax=Cercopithifilaria johnstoni TaxID=2874296 RepID=A0A8J2M4Y9_9BILA|nr:unnamed protein product [Cercopithifilaria johnstoni]